MNLQNLIEYIARANSFAELIATEPNQSRKGNIFEKTWSLALKHGLHPAFPNDVYAHYDGNINTGLLTEIDNTHQYITQDSAVLGRGRGGASDITMRNKQTGEWIFVSCKFYTNDARKHADDYDIEKLMAVAAKNPGKFGAYKIVLAVNSATKVADVFAASQRTNAYLVDNVARVLDVFDLESIFSSLVRTAQAIIHNPTAFETTKPTLVLRFHQELITHQMMRAIASGQTQLLLGAKARSGKTYCVGGLFAKIFAERGALNALVVTPAPTETISQFTTELFKKFKEFNDIGIFEIQSGRQLLDLDFSGNKTNGNIVVVSKQLLDGFVGERGISAICDLDIIVFDENHFHGTTQMSKDILETYAKPATVKLFLTATYAKPLHVWNVPDKCRWYWDIEDEHMCKARDIAGLTARHGPDVALFVSPDTARAVLSVYDTMPNMLLITTMMDQARYDTIKANIRDTVYGFSFSTLLSGAFPDEVDTLLRFVSGSNRECDFPEKDLSIFGRIRANAARETSRTTLTNADFSTQLWFLPVGGTGMAIDRTSKHLLDRMSSNSVFARFDIRIINSKKEFALADIKGEIAEWEACAKRNHKSGLILLAGTQLSLGVTLPFVDVVVLMNDTYSGDKVIQMMYRCMTERIATTENNSINAKPKKFGIVVDLNIARVVNTLLEFPISQPNLSFEDKLAYIVNHNLIQIDPDLFCNTESRKDITERLIGVWKASPTNTIRTLLKQLEAEVILLDSPDQQRMNRAFTKSNGDNVCNVKIVLGDIAQPLPSGTTVNVDPDSGDAEPQEDTDTELKISITKDVLPFILPLSCILTRGTGARDFAEMIDIIKNHPYLLGIFKEQTFVWWNRNDVFEFIEELVHKYIKKNSVVYSTCIYIQMSLQSLIDRPDELLSTINECLKPKQKEKQENGEVFTPMPLVFEMLDQLDIAYTEENGESIFGNPTLTWFDPAAGMGNFPVAVYLRLMTGLVSKIPDDAARKKHILENMLFMNELNAKNVFVCRQIFDINGVYNIHIHEGDSLQLNFQKIWGLEPEKKFDVVLGNPPYNKGGIRSHTGAQLGAKNETIWTKFVVRTFNSWLADYGYLVFITPLSWLKKSHSLHGPMLDRHVVWLKLWDNIKSLATIRGKIPISLYIIQNVLNAEHNSTNIISEIQSKKLLLNATEYLDSTETVPLAYHSIFRKLAKFIRDNNCRLEYKSKTIKSAGIKCKVPAEYSLADDWAIDTYTIKDGILVKKAETVHPDADKQKLVIANKSGFAGTFIDNGKLSLTGNHKFYILGNNLELVKKIMEFGIISSIVCDYTKYGQDFLDADAFRYIPDLRKMNIADIGEREFYALINLDDNEIRAANPTLDV